MRALAAVCLAGILAAAAAWAAGPVVLADFERGALVSGDGYPGWRPEDVRKIAVLTLDDGSRYGRFFFAAAGISERSAYLRYRMRRRYLATGTSVLSAPPEPNVVRFRLRLPADSVLTCDEGARPTLGVWTYHLAPEDPFVGGADGTSGSTDSMMHGYANFCVHPGARGRWLEVMLAPSAFRQQRDYYHWFAAQGVTGEVPFVASLRELQFVVFPKDEGGVHPVDLDEIALDRVEPTGVFEPGFRRLDAWAEGGDVVVPVRLVNPTNRDRRYRVFVSSELGASREALYRAFVDADSDGAPTAVQKAVGGDGGLGVAVLTDATGEPVGYREIAVPAGGAWEGSLVHRIRPEMLGPPVAVRYREHTWTVRRDTLTTSVIAWDPDEPATLDMDEIVVAPSNADDGRHAPPPGFPPQETPPDGWQSADVPAGQVGAYLVTEITLR
ncbi:hypothetical protein [Deferrisoma palaeochoriense]